MTLNPTLKSILVRTLYIVVSPIAYWVLYRVLFLIWPSLEMHTTIDGVWMFAVALAIIWFNVCKLAKPIQLITIGTYLFVFAGLIFWYKTDDISVLGIGENDSILSNYLMARLFLCLGFILLASILPIFLKSTDVPNFAKFGKVWIWTAILILDFVAAMPNIYFQSNRLINYIWVSVKWGTHINMLQYMLLEILTVAMYLFRKIRFTPFPNTI